MPARGTGDELGTRPGRIVGAAAALTALGAWLLLDGGCTRRADAPGGPARGAPAPTAQPLLAGSGSCRSCHAEFHRKWATSWHGSTVRPVGDSRGETRLPGGSPELAVGSERWRAVTDAPEPHFLERQGGAQRRWPISHVVGGKDVCYFLTGRERGFLQVLPLAWDVRRREWFRTAESAVRHAEGLSDAALPWTDRAFTFNTSCASCHVSQLRTGYDARADSYSTVWGEPGISCETCHGNAAEHVRVFERRARASSPPPHDAADDLRILSLRRLGAAQRNDLCLSCHAKAGAVGPPFEPGEAFFDHYDLVLLESREYYPDGRDLGENYTATSWLLSPCARSGRLDCLHCHTSSGRYRFAERPNDACLPCHADRVRDAARHSRHAPERPGGRCTDCHMPTTEFARMRRSDHSMRPPLPAASLAFGSPNACTSCHPGRDARWAGRVVRSWRAGRPSAIEERALREGELVAAAREGDGRRLGAILGYLGEPDHDPVVAASLVRLLAGFADPAKEPVLRALVSDRSPLVRAAAVGELAADPGATDALLAAARDAVRLVRLRAAFALAGRDLSGATASQQADAARATEELERSLQARDDQFPAHFELGVLAAARGRDAEAAARYRRAVALRPDHVASLVNLSLVEARLGRLADAEPPLRQALRSDPRSVAAHLNLALLLAETGRASEAEAELRNVLAIDPRQAQAAYNLALLVADRDPGQAAALARRAAEAAPTEPRYAEAARALAANASRRPHPPASRPRPPR